MSSETRLTAAALAVTVVAAVMSMLDIVEVLTMRARGGAWGATAAQLGFLLIVTFLVYGACVYHLARLGYLRRIGRHVPVPDRMLSPVFGEDDPPLVTILVPSYMEEERVIRRTLLSAALQGYPRRRVVLLIDDPSIPRTERDAEGLAAARGLPGDIRLLLQPTRMVCASALAEFRRRRANHELDIAHEERVLAGLHARIAAWFDEQADAYETMDHADRLFVDLAFRTPARRSRHESTRLRNPRRARPGTPADELDLAYRRLLAQFDVEITSFERKRYDNLPHGSNKAMNLNSYISLLGGSFREVRCAEGLVLERARGDEADLEVPDTEFLLALDADSVLTSDYALRLVHFMRERGHEDVAIVQAPYSAFPDAPGAVERIAGATTDIQCIIHQGFSRYGATYWVGANAVIRTAALRDIVSYGMERGHRIARFIQDRTLIEDTDSTVDLLAKGWRLSNYPARLAYSETPVDFGALLIQRRRWANGGLIILPKLLRYLATATATGGRVAQGFMMAHYLTSLAAVNVGLMLALAFCFEDSVRSVWLPLTAVPYFLLYARDLRLAGYRGGDILRVYALNLVLIPVHLVGVAGSLFQAVGGRKAAFGRTPKVQGRTGVPPVYLVVELGLVMQWLVRALQDVLEHRPVHAVLATVNTGFLLYGLATFIGVRNSLGDLAEGMGKGQPSPAPEDAVRALLDAPPDRPTRPRSRPVGSG